MNDSRLRLALEKLTHADWERFERFASEFLAVEISDLRTVASASGDGGRDADLVSPSGDPTQVLQYSVDKDWASKIRRTAARLSETRPSSQLLVYVTNQLIGASADELKNEVRNKWHLYLDIRDRGYFLERYRQNSRTEAAAERLAEDIVDPYLASEGVGHRTSVLQTHEAKAAHLYLSLQLRDDAQEKGLTKLSFEALVRSVLLGTTSERRMKRADVKAAVRRLLPGDHSDQIDQLTDSALSRLTKRAIKHWPPQDEFCLSFEETRRLSEYMANQELNELALRDAIRSIVNSVSPGPQSTPADVESAAIRLRRIVESALHQRAESFASAVMAGNPSAFATDHLHGVILDDLRSQTAAKGSAEADPGWLKALVHELLRDRSDAIRQYLRDLADAYTIMAFLRQTPDVQSAVSKMFSHGEIWLDTSAVLPLLAEELFDEDRLRQFQPMVQLARDAGLEFFTTEGVIEELDRHIYRCMTCASQPTRWEGRFPFLVDVFLQVGRQIGEFSDWTEGFRGSSRPLDDIREYLSEKFGIELQNLDKEAATADQRFRFAVQEVWHSIHRHRREQSGNYDPIAVQRLSMHDSESFVGVVQRRRQEKPSPFGYSTWWLTYDRAGLKIGDLLRSEFGIDAPDSPVLSLDFLAQYLTLGPIRSRIGKAAACTLPAIIEPRLARFLTSDLLAEASQIREETKGMPERVVRRRVRDHLDKARRRMGPLAHRGTELIFDAVGGF